jgi:diaminohydroxyphosphoribosylaminopyrimidine deaminase/5-amino-6-(5-phosphoribosylamino)uracil reductase
MQAALGLAQRCLGQVAPNPAVGCILVRPDLGNRVVGRGWTQPGGRPHAETEALRRAGELAKGATAYITLEPCSHTGQTPPCADALINAKINRVVIAMQDPDPRVSGRGIAKLKDAGLEVKIKVLKSDSEQLNIGFINKIQLSRPSFSWKTATSLDGKIATTTGHSKWITEPDARQVGQLLRAKNDAVIIGIGTALVDDPDLTCRLPGCKKLSPIRIITDSQLRLPLTHKLVVSAHQFKTWIFTKKNHNPEKSAQLQNEGISIFECDEGSDGHLDIRKLSQNLAEKGLTRILIEGGAELSSSFLKHDLVDQIFWFRAPKMIGNDGLPVAKGLNILTIDNTRAFTQQGTYDIGPDRLEIYHRNRAYT